MCPLGLEPPSLAASLARVLHALRHACREGSLYTLCRPPSTCITALMRMGVVLTVLWKRLQPAGPKHLGMRK